MKIRRDIASVPLRSAKDTWNAIVNLVTGSETLDRTHLDSAAGLMASIIADESPSGAPIVFSGAGPRVVLYCRYGDEALETGLEIDALPSNPTAGDWRATVPCEPDDVEWMAVALEQRAPRITVHAADTSPDDTEPTAATGFEVDWEALNIR